MAKERETLVLVERAETPDELERFQNLKDFIEGNIHKRADSLREKAGEEGWSEADLYFMARESLLEEWEARQRR